VTQKSCRKQYKKRGSREKNQNHIKVLHTPTCSLHPCTAPATGMELQLRTRWCTASPNAGIQRCALGHRWRRANGSRRRAEKKSGNFEKPPKVRMLCHCSANREGEAGYEKERSKKTRTPPPRYAAQPDAASLFSPRIRRPPLA